MKINEIDAKSNDVCMLLKINRHPIKFCRIVDSEAIRHSVRDPEGGSGCMAMVEDHRRHQESSAAPPSGRRPQIPPVSRL